MVERRMPRFQEVVLPILREAFPDVMVTTWIPAVEDRKFPLINVRRVGGLPVDVDFLDIPVIELTVYSDENLAKAENLFLDARQALWNAVGKRNVSPAGYIHSYRETMGPTQFDSPFDDTWRVQALIALGLRPNRF